MWPIVVEYGGSPRSTRQEALGTTIVTKDDR